MKFYLDTSIWMDVYENRLGYQGELLGEYAERLLAMILLKKHVLVVTDLLFRELSLQYPVPVIRGMMTPFKTILERLNSTNDEVVEAERIAQDRDVPRGDALHAILARDHQLILVSRDNHFRKLTDISQTHLPESFI